MRGDAKCARRCSIDAAVYDDDPGCGGLNVWRCADDAVVGAGEWLVPRLPDYVTLGAGGGYAFLGGQVNLTVTRGGHVYVGLHAGLATTGGEVYLKAGWVQPAAPTEADVQDYVHGWSGQASGFVPVAGPAGPSGSFTWGHPGRFQMSATGHELGIGVGNPSASATFGYNFGVGGKLPWGW